MNKIVAKWIAERAPGVLVGYAVPAIRLSSYGYVAMILVQRSASQTQRKKVMRKFAASVALVALLVGVAGVSTPSRAETGQVAVVFTKGGLIVGVGGGEGVLVLRGNDIRSRSPA